MFQNSLMIKWAKTCLECHSQVTTQHATLHTSPTQHILQFSAALTPHTSALHIPSLPIRASFIHFAVTRIVRLCHTVSCCLVRSPAWPPTRILAQTSLHPSIRPITKNRENKLSSLIALYRCAVCFCVILFNRHPRRPIIQFVNLLDMFLFLHSSIDKIHQR